MNKLIALCGLVLLSTTTTPQEGNNGLESNVQEVEVTMTSAGGDNQFAYVMNGPTLKAAPKLVSRINTESPKELNLDEIIYIEEEVPVELGFNTEDYLPEDFNPYEQYVDLNSIEFIEEEEEEETWDLGFDASVYLPDNFNPYAIPGDVMNIDYIEEGEDEVDLGFDTAKYLPEDFDPYDVYVNFDSIEFYEDDELGPNFWTVDEILNL